MKVYSQRTMNYELELAIGVLKILVGQFINDQFTPRNKAMSWTLLKQCFGVSKKQFQKLFFGSTQKPSIFGTFGICIEQH